MTSPSCSPPGEGVPKGEGRGGKAASCAVARPGPSGSVTPSRPPSRPYPAAPASPNPSPFNILRGIKRDQGVAGPAGPSIAPGQDGTRNTRTPRTRFGNFDVRRPYSTRNHRNRHQPRSGAVLAVRAAESTAPKGVPTAPPKPSPRTRRHCLRPSPPSMQGAPARRMTSPSCSPPGEGVPKGGGRGGKAGSCVVARPGPSGRALLSRPPGPPPPRAGPPPNLSPPMVPRGSKWPWGVAGPAGPFIAPAQNMPTKPRAPRTRFGNFDVRAPNSARSHGN